MGRATTDRWWKGDGVVLENELTVYMQGSAMWSWTSNWTNIVLKIQECRAVSEYLGFRNFAKGGFQYKSKYRNGGVAHLCDGTERDKWVQ